MVDEAGIATRFQAIRALFDECARRLFAGAEALAIGRGGVAAVARATGLSEPTVRRGVADVRAGETLPKGRVRRAGAGRPRATTRDPQLREDLDRLVEQTTRGDRQSPLRWTCKSVRQLAGALQERGHTVSYQTVAKLLHEMGYSLQANQKTVEGSHHPDRNARFEHINAAVQLQLRLDEPVISVGRTPYRSSSDLSPVDTGVSGGVKRVLARSMAMRIRRRWSATVRRARPWEWPRARASW